MATILTKKSDTASAVPLAADLTNATGGAELAVNATDKRLFSKTSGGTVVELGTNPSSLTLPNGTANGLAFLNASKVVTSGSALTFDGTNLGVGGSLNTAAGRAVLTLNAATDTAISFGRGGTSVGFILQDAGGQTFYNSENTYQRFYINATEQMRLTSTGLGIGTSSPAAKLHVVGNTRITADIESTGNSVIYSSNGSAAGTINSGFNLVGSDSSVRFYTGNSERMRLDSSGNLGLGVTPSAWSAFKAFEIASVGNSLWSAGSNDLRFATNHVYNGGNKYAVNGYAAQYIQTAGQHQFYTAASGTAGNAITFTQAMTLDASGNLLVGKTTSTGVGSQNIEVSNSSSSTVAIKGGSNEWSMLVSSSSDSLRFYEDSTERARIDSSGNLCVGATSKVYDGKISVGFSSTGSQGIALIDNTATTGGIYAYFINSSGNVAGSITHNGTTTVAYNTSSDYRLKDITGPITTSGAYIDSLKPVEGTWKSDGSVFVGLLAHEAQEASRTAVATGTKDGAEMQAMDYSSPEIIANLIAEVKSLRQRVAQLEAQ